MVTVYRCVDSRGLPLYVGQTVNLKQRLAYHRWNAAWWHKVCDVEVVAEFASTDDARRCEAETIFAETPPHNVQHNPERSHPALLRMRAGTEVA